MVLATVSIVATFSVPVLRELYCCSYYQYFYDDDDMGYKGSVFFSVIPFVYILDPNVVRYLHCFLILHVFHEFLFI